jgi:signal transduction histidine kinase
MRKLDFVTLARDTAEAYRPQLEKSGFDFKCELPEQALDVHADRDALAQVIVNLLSNAEKYSGSQREIILRIELHNSPLRHVELQVLDRGLGVAAGCEEKIFEKFYRAHDSLSSGIQGSGLGLTLARQIARAHGGDVAYLPREGSGSCFILRLPLGPPNE